MHIRTHQSGTWLQSSRYRFDRCSRSHKPRANTLCTVLNMDRDADSDLDTDLNTDTETQSFEFEVDRVA